jgi:hypothetical protein
MDVIKSGLEHVAGGASGCPCICSTGWSGADTIGLEGGTCGFNCGCLIAEFFDNAEANSKKAYRIFNPEQ